MTEAEIKFMIEDLKQKQENSSDGTAWMWFGYTEKLMLSDATKRKQVENLTFIECSELLLLWNKREEELNKERKKQIEQQNRNKLSQI